MALGAVGLWLMARAFPGALGSGQDKAWVGYYLAWAVLISLRLFSGGPMRWGEKAKHAAIWVGIIALIAVGYSYRGELGQVVQRVQGEASGGYPVATGAREMVVTAADDGGFYVMGKVNGQVVRFLVDTGASDTVLSPADAQRAGIDTGVLTFDYRSETANGTGYGARIVVDSLSVGSVTLADLPVMVNQADMSSSLLGMSFLHRLESFQVRDGKLYLKARG
jgi:aspartyl protease family protein